MQDTPTSDIGDPRRGTRFARNTRGALHFGGKRHDCVVRDVSARGALIEVASFALVPDDFTLSIGDAGPRSCAVSRRDGNLIGVVFVSGC